MAPPIHSDSKKVVLVGNPNVGKSVIFRMLTGNYALVSNFAGTTVEISRGWMQLGGITYQIVDTPGINSLVPQSEDELVTCEILLREKPDVIVQIADAKNMRRTLLITSQLAEFGIPLVLVLNMIDEAEERGVAIDSQGISDYFSIPAVETIAIYAKGKRQLLNAIQSAKKPRNPLLELFPGNHRDPGLNALSPPVLLSIEWMAGGDRDFARIIDECLGSEAGIRLKEWLADCRSSGRNNPAREIAEIRNKLLDKAVASFKKKRPVRFLEESGSFNRFWLAMLIFGLFIFFWNALGGVLGIPTPFGAAFQIIGSRTDALIGAHFQPESLLRNVLLGKNPDGRLEYGLIPELVHFLLCIAPVIIPLGVLTSGSRRFAYELGILTRRASTGIPILFVVLLLLYEFVGYTGAQTLVGLVEKVMFGQHLVPFLRTLLPSGFFSELTLGKYGLVSMGLTYAIGIILPVVGTFFIAFGLLEDSGYIPRLSILSDRLLRWLGLNGKAVLPMVLGFGCGTMATMSTRILGSKRERFIAIFLLALGIPCSAQLGVMLGIAAGVSPKATLTVIGVVASQLLLVGWLSARFIRGRRSEFIFEIPPIRVPQLKNVALKTWYRVQWYLKEAVPLFLAGTLILFVLDSVRLMGRDLLSWMQAALEPVIEGLLHLPAEAAGILLLGFLRRDYGAAGLYDLARKGLLSGQQIVVSMIVLTLFIPCLASFFMIIKEQGWKRAAAMAAFIAPFAVAVGAAVSWILRALNIQFN